MCVTFASFSPDASVRFSIAAGGDVDGRRILAGFIPAFAGATRDRVWDSRASGGNAQPIAVVVNGACGFEVSIDGELTS